MAAMRTYGDACGIARALDLVGERWALMIVRELLLGPKRFTDLRTGLPHASPNVLAQRLRELESAGVIEKRRLPPPAASQVYDLTDWGRGLEPIVMAFGAWGAHAPDPPEGVGMSLDSHILSLRTLFDPRARGTSRPPSPSPSRTTPSGPASSTAPSTSSPARPRTPTPPSPSPHPPSSR